MNNQKSNSDGLLIGLFKSIGGFLKDAWNTAEACGPCCGIRLDRQKRSDDMPTPSSCCGVRV
jgi:hypothetical protein